MTKMQIIAKAALTFLGLGTAVNLCSHLRLLTSLEQNTSTLRAILFSPIFIILLILTAHFLIFKNNRLACKMAGPGEELNSESETLWLASSLQMVAVLYGLILLAASIPTILNIIVSPLYICHMINEILTFKTFPKSLIFTSSQWSYMIYNFLKAILAVYLLYGWPHFIRFQLNLRKTKSPLNQKQYIEGNENE